MSKSTYLSLSTLIAGLLACLVACAAGGEPTATGTTPSAGPPWPCLSGPGVASLPVPAAPGLLAAEIGTGTRAVVFSNESDEDACAWAGFASEVAGLGYRAVLYDYTGKAPSGDLSAVMLAVNRSGATSVALVGASEGAKTSIIAAADATGVDAVVSLSAESSLRGVAVAPYAARLRVPTLFVTADQDPYGATSATQLFYDSAPATDKRLLVRPGTAHGTALLNDPAVHAAVLDFLRGHDPTAGKPATSGGQS